MISGTPVERVSTEQLQVPRVNISEDLTDCTHQTQVKKAGKDCTICDS